MIGIPPWIASIDPIAPVKGLLQGYSEGRAAGTAQRSAELADNELQVRQQNAADILALRQQEEARRADQFQQGLEIRLQQAERAAEEASIRMEGQRGFDSEFQQAVAQGLTPTMAMAQTLPKWATKMFWNRPQAVGPALKAVAPVEPPQPGWTPSGLEYMTDAKGGVHFPPAGLAKPVDPTAPTTAVKGRLQTGLLQGEKAVELGTELWDKLSPEDLGAKGVFNRVVVNEGLAQIFPGMAKDSVANVQSLLGNFNEKAVAAITSSGDKRVSDKDMARYQKMLPKLTAGESLESARTKIATFMDELRREAIKDADRLKMPHPDWTLSKAEIVDAYKTGKITREHATELLKRFHTRD